MLSVEAARAAILAGVEPVEAERLPLAAALGRVLAAPVAAAVANPGADVSAMDGYAVRTADLTAGARLHVIGEAPAGAPFGGVVAAGQAVRIFTGGVLPAGADRVVIQEDVERTGDAVAIPVVPGGGDHVRRAGSDFAAGRTLAPAGARVDGARAALVAAGNVAEVAVRRRPRVAIAPTGDELVAPGEPLAPGAVVSSTPFALAALIADWGGAAHTLAPLPDTVADGAARLQERDAAEADVLVTLGGASVGERDLVKPMVQALGAEIAFERVRVRPGKPTWFARAARPARVLGLPGNPVSAIVCAHLFLRPLLDALLGRDPAVRFASAVAAGPFSAVGVRETYMRSIAWIDVTGSLRVRPLAEQDSSFLAPLTAANALVRRAPDAPAINAGERVEALLLSAPMTHAEAPT